MARGIENLINAGALTAVTAYSVQHTDVVIKIAQVAGTGLLGGELLELELE